MGTGVVVSSLYYQGATGKGSAKAGKESGSGGGSSGGGTTARVVAACGALKGGGGGARERISFGGVGQTPTRAAPGAHDPQDAESAVLLAGQPGGRL